MLQMAMTFILAGAIPIALIAILIDVVLRLLEND